MNASLSGARAFSTDLEPPVVSSPTVTEAPYRLGLPFFPPCIMLATVMKSLVRPFSLFCLLTLACLCPALRAQSLSTQHPPADPFQQVYAKFIADGDAEMAKDHAGKAAENYTKAVALTNPEKQPDPWSMAVTLLAEAMLQQDRADMAEQLSGSVLKLADQGRVKNAWTIGHAAWTFATVMMSEKDWVRAEEAYVRSLNAAEEYGGKEHPATSNVLYALSVALRNQGKYPEAEAALRRAIGIDGRTGGEHHSDLARDIYKLGVLLTGVGLTVDAEELLLHALSIDESNSGPNSDAVIRDLAALARCQLLEGNGLLERIRDPYRTAVDGAPLHRMHGPPRDFYRALMIPAVRSKLRQAAANSRRCLQALVARGPGEAPVEGITEEEEVNMYKIILRAQRIPAPSIDALAKAAVSAPAQP